MKKMYQGSLNLSRPKLSKKTKAGIMGLCLLVGIGISESEQIYSHVKNWCANGLQEIEQNGSSRVDPYVQRPKTINVVPGRGPDYYADILIKEAPKGVTKTNLSDWIDVHNPKGFKTGAKAIVPEWKY